MLRHITPICVLFWCCCKGQELPRARSPCPVLSHVLRKVPWTQFSAWGNLSQVTRLDALLAFRLFSPCIAASLLTLLFWLGLRTFLFPFPHYTPRNWRQVRLSVWVSPCSCSVVCAFFIVTGKDSPEGKKGINFQSQQEQWVKNK